MDSLINASDLDAALRNSEAPKRGNIRNDVRPTIGRDVAYQVNALSREKANGRRKLVTTPDL